ncbi:hypothetical protein F5146DRAFT_672449 [Armillaria mellea]|nr:hypothetical protein F5146DRAFT_672449 [Armillaria mellea]
MVSQCPICLNNLKDPVCPPCGHAFCAECLSRAVAQVNNGTQAPCPYCRKVFPIVMPNGQSLPPQLRPFVMDPIRRVYITTDNSQDQQNTRQHIESLERENRNLEERIEELEAESEELLAPILLPSFPGPDLDPVLSVASNLSNSMNIEGDSAHPRRPPSFASEPQFIHPQYVIDAGPARSLAPVSAIRPNMPNSSHTIVETFTITRQETWVTPSTRSGGVPMPSTTE